MMQSLSKYRASLAQLHLKFAY